MIKKFNNLLFIICIGFLCIGCDEKSTLEKIELIRKEFDRDYGKDTTKKIWCKKLPSILENRMDIPDYDFYVQNHLGVWHVVTTDGITLKRELIFPAKQ